MYPGRRTYKGAEDEQAISEIAIRESLIEDIYLVFQGPAPSDPSGRTGAFHIYLNPLVVWVWIGGVVLGSGHHHCAAAQQEIRTGARRKEECRRSRQRRDSNCEIPFVAEASQLIAARDCCFSIPLLGLRTRNGRRPWAPN